MRAAFSDRLFYGSIFSVETRSILAPENSLSEKAARIRFELTDLDIERVSTENMEPLCDIGFGLVSCLKRGNPESVSEGRSHTPRHSLPPDSLFFAFLTSLCRSSFLAVQSEVVRVKRE
jgi:hypothetical protein